MSSQSQKETVTADSSYNIFTRGLSHSDDVIDGGHDKVTKFGMIEQCSKALRGSEGPGPNFVVGTLKLYTKTFLNPHPFWDGKLL